MNRQKKTIALIYLCSRLGTLNRHLCIYALWLASKLHLSKYGRPIIEDFDEIPTFWTSMEYLSKSDINMLDYVCEKLTNYFIEDYVQRLPCFKKWKEVQQMDVELLFQWGDLSKFSDILTQENIEASKYLYNEHKENEAYLRG